MRTLIPAILILLTLGMMFLLAPILAAPPPAAPTPAAPQPLSVLAPMGLGEWRTQNSHTSADLYAVQFLDDQQGFAAGENGVLLRTTDGGDTWDHLSTGTQTTIRTIHFFDAQHGWLAGWLRTGSIRDLDRHTGPASFFGKNRIRAT